MAGLMAAASQIDPSLPPYVMTLSLLKGFIGGAAGAYFGNGIHNRRMKNQNKSKEVEKVNE
jgi:hypothetical protein